MRRILKLGIMVLILVMLGGMYLLKSNSTEKSLEKQDKQYQTGQPNIVSNKEQKNNSKEENNKESARGDSQDNVLKETRNNIPMLIDLGAGTCIPCKMMQPVLEEITREYEGKATVKIIDVYENRDEATKYGIRAIPTQIFFDASGKEVFRHEGYFPKEEIVAKFKEMGIK